jgi:hypothetical protein
MNGDADVFIERLSGDSTLPASLFLGVDDFGMKDEDEDMANGDDAPLLAGILVISTRSMAGEERSVSPLLALSGLFLSMVRPAGMGGVVSLDDPDTLAAKDA